MSCFFLVEVKFVRVGEESGVHQNVSLIPGVASCVFVCFAVLPQAMGVIVRCSHDLFRFVFTVLSMLVFDGSAGLAACPHVLRVCFGHFL